MKYTIKETKRYRKAYKRVRQKLGFKREKLIAIIETLAQGKALPAVCKDHQLTGDMQQYRECHVQPDVLLMYQKFDEMLVLVLVKIGSHPELFG